MPLNVDEVKLYGPADVLVNGVSVGHTTMEGVTLKRTPKVTEAKVAKFGDTPVSKWQDGEKVEVEFTLAQSNFGMLLNAIPGATLITNVGGQQKLTFGKIAGSQYPAVSLVLKPFVAANTPGFDVTIPKAIAIGEFEVAYVGEKFNGFKCKFEGVVNETGGVDGNYLWTLGDAAITLDTVAPTVTTVVPADAAVGVAVTPGTVVWTLSEELDGNTVNSASVKVFEDPTGVGPTGLEVPGSVVLVNNGASTTITFTPTAALQALTKHIAVLQRVKDKAGNLLASGFYASEFTTA